MPKNKAFVRILSLSLSVFLMLPCTSYALDEKIDLPCASAILREGIGGKVLYSKNADEKRSPASITKIMSILLVMEALEEGNITLDDEVTASSHAASMGGSQIWLRENEVMTVDELLKASAIASANDATVALAEYIAGSEESFAAMMNEKASELGMKNTSFKNATGLDEEGHFTTAEDISIMAMELIKYPLIKKYSTLWMDSLRDGKTQLVNTNRLIRFYKGATGLKTGTTDEALCCLCATAERDDLPLIAVTLGSPTSKERFKSAQDLLNFGFSKYKAVKCPSLVKAADPVRVKRGARRYAGVYYRAPEFLVTDKQDKAPLDIKIEKSEEINAPIDENAPLGRVKIMQGNEILSEILLMSSCGIEKLTYFNSINRIFRNVFSL